MPDLRNGEGPGVVTPERVFRAPWRWVLDLLFGRFDLPDGLRRDTREFDRDSIDGVVGADLPSM